MSVLIENLSKTYENGVEALKGISIEFKKNKITGLIGFNGSGKTTTFNILVNFIEKYGGKVYLDGRDPKTMNYSEISYLASGLESKNLMRAQSHLFSIAEIYGMEKKEAKAIIEKYSKLLDFSQFLKKSIRSLSNGNKQKVKLIACFLNPNLKYLFLDEPFNGIDPIIVKKIVEIILSIKKNITIIITSHRMEIVDKVCDEFFVLKDGKIVDSKMLDSNNVIIEVNKEVNLEKLRNKSGVLEIIKLKDHSLILINDISYFQDVNSELVKSKNYIYSSLKRKNLVSSVFEAYK